jgi:predicted ATPase
VLFKVIPNRTRTPISGNSIVYLWTDNWNDYWDFNTLYVLTYFDDEGAKHEIGNVKIGQFKWQKGQGRPEIPDEFESLDERFFSLGQSDEYYSSLYNLGATGRKILEGLKDVVIDPELFNRALDERVTDTSLLRSVSESSVKGQFARIMTGGARLTEYQFSYKGPTRIGSHEVENVEIEFDVQPESSPPTNIHVIIGRNGVGKSYLLNSMVRSIVGSEYSPEFDGEFSSTDEDGDPVEIPFANVVSVSFSAFDEFELLPDADADRKRVGYSYVGLRALEDRETGTATVIRGPRGLAKQFSESALACRQGPRRGRWRAALESLQADRLFKDANVVELVDARAGPAEFRKLAESLFKNLSSGHKIVLLTITKLVEKVEERSLVLMDEPEAHLHPPLLSAFVRALSELLINRNGVAIVATHSPVVLQEVPRSCVWNIVRFGSVSRADRFDLETFAENVGSLTRAVFGLEVTETGFHKMLADAARGEDTVQAVANKFKDQVGGEGRALISGIIAERKRDEGGALQ